MSSKRNPGLIAGLEEATRRLGNSGLQGLISGLHSLGSRRLDAGQGDVAEWLFSASIALAEEGDRRRRVEVEIGEELDSLVGGLWDPGEGDTVDWPGSR